MSLSKFISGHSESIVTEWAGFAKTLLPSAQAMTDEELRDHGQAILLTICQQMETRQSETERAEKSKGGDGSKGETPSAAQSHGALRQIAGFDLVQLVAEFRAMRACVLALWRKAKEAEAAAAHAIEEIARFNEGIDQALAESVDGYSERVDASRDMFLAVLGHDLRGPLAGISMSNMLLLHPGLSEEARLSAAARIGRATRAMSGLINDLIDFTRTRLGAGIPIHTSACHLRPVCEDAVEAALAAYPDCEFVLTVAADPMLQGDVPRLQQALSNLLNNAVQHGERGQPVLIHAGVDGQRAVIAITNRGQPISPDAIGSIFEPLVQACETSAAPHERTKTSMGLGLFIVREIVHGHEGGISVVSSAAAGTTFTLWLPLDSGPAGQRPA